MNILKQNNRVDKTKFILSILIISLLVVNNIFAQNENAEHLVAGKHLITGAIGYSYIPKGASKDASEAEGVFVPSIGMDYFYSIAPKWEIGIMVDIEFGEYFIFEKDLNRENAFIVTAIGVYSLTNNLSLFAGGGIELEKHHNLAVFRVGTEYAFKFENGWLLAPGLFYDIKEGYDTWAIQLSVGKSF